MTDENTFIAAFHRADGSVTRTTQKLVNGEVSPRLEETVRRGDQLTIFSGGLGASLAANTTMTWRALPR